MREKDLLEFDVKAKDISNTGPKPTNKENSIYIPEPIVGHIIGKGGRTINTIAETYEVEISLKEKKEDRDGGKVALLAGTPEGVKQAVEHIRKIIKMKEENERERQERIQTRKRLVCTNYKYGKGCRYGDRCEFQHVRRDEDVTATRTRDRNQNTMRSRSRTQSPQKRYHPRTQSQPRNNNRDGRARQDSPRRSHDREEDNKGRKSESRERERHRYRSSREQQRDREGTGRQYQNRQQRRNWNR